MSKCIYKNRLGKAGEQLASDFLVDKGYSIIKRNFRFERAEVDIIAIDKNTNVLIFAEVKTRRNKRFGEPEESITPTKQANIKKAAEGFILENLEYAGYDMRIDVITIMASDSEAVVNHIENAF